MSSTKDGGYPFEDKARHYRTFDMEALVWSRADAQRAQEAMRGHDPVAEGWYADDVATLAAEIRRRCGPQDKLLVRQPARL